MRFKDWFAVQEEMTSTSGVAGFNRHALPMVTRTWPAQVATVKYDSWEEEPKGGKKRRKQPQVSD